MKHIHITIICFIISTSAGVWAGNYDNVCCKAARYATDHTLSNTLAHADAMILSNRLYSAAAAFEKISAVYDTQLRSTMTPEGPLDLVVQTARIMCLNEAFFYKNPACADQCLLLLEKYATPARGKQWTAYIRLYHCLIRQYQSIGNIGKVLKTAGDLFAYDRAAGGTIYMENLLRHRADPRHILDVVQAYREAGCTDTAVINAIECEAIRLNGGDSLNACMKFMRTYPDQPFSVLKRVLNTARASLSIEKPEQIRAYYTWMKELAIRQPGDDAHIEYIVWLNNEQRKLETLVPEMITETEAP